MKKIITILMLMTIGLSAQAAEYLKIGDVSVNLNQDTTNGTGGLTAGYYKYFYAAKKLVLYGAKTSTDAGVGIDSNVEGLTILFNGDNTIYGVLYGIALSGNTDMSINSGTVTCSCSFNDALYTHTYYKPQTTIRGSGGDWYFNGTVSFGGKLTIKNTHMNVTYNGTNSSTAISGLDVLEVDNSTLKVNAGTSHTSVDAPVVLKGCVIADVKTVRAKQITDGSVKLPLPQYSASEPAFLYDTKGSLVTGSLTIKPGTAYGLWISGVQLNSENYGNIWQLETMGAAQSIALLSYTPTTKTLKLQATQGIMASLASQYSGFPTIHNEISGLIINSAQGNNFISAASEGGGVAIESLADCTIKGVLNVIGGEYSIGIKTENSNMTIDNATLAVISGGDYGLYGENSKVFVNNSNLTISGSERAIYVENDGFDPDDNCFITVPEGGLNFIDGIYTRDASTGVMTPATTVSTRPNVRYSLWIKGVQISDINSNYIKNILNSSAEGSITFTPPNTLNIDGLKIKPTEDINDYFIKTTMDELVMNLTGTSYLRAKSGKTLLATDNLTVKGSGSINIDTNDELGLQIKGTLKITDGARFLGSGQSFGISAAGLEMDPGTELQAAAYSETGSSLICNSWPTLRGVALPSNMYFGTVGQDERFFACYKETGQPVTRAYVTINAANAAGLVTDINEAITEQATETIVYSTSGQLLWQGKGQPQLPRGIYIVNGRKVAVR